MSAIAALVTASFTVPERITVDPQSMLWLLPLVASIAIVYKATKVPKIAAASFLKEVVILFGSIVIFMAVTAMVLGVLGWLITE
jgi:Ca2+/Na+ antiporter